MSSMDLEELLSELGRVSGYIWQFGWAEGNGGNISVNLGPVEWSHDALATIPAKVSPDLIGLSFLVTVSGSRFRDIAHAPEQNTIVLCGTKKGWDIISSPDKDAKPTSEWVSHAKIHSAIKGNGYKVVMHSHPPKLIALTHMPGINEKTINRILFGIHPELRIFLSNGMGMPEYAMPGTMELAHKTIESLKDHRVVVWPFHGGLAVEQSIEKAFDLLHMVEKCAGIYLTCLSAGYRPEGLTAAQLTELDRWWKDRDIPYL